MEVTYDLPVSAFLHELVHRQHRGDRARDVDIDHILGCMLRIRPLKTQTGYLKKGTYQTPLGTVFEVVRNSTDFVQMRNGPVLLVQRANVFSELLLRRREVKFGALNNGACITQLDYSLAQ